MLRNLWTGLRMALLCPPANTQNVRTGEGALWFAVGVLLACEVFYSWLYLPGPPASFAWYGFLPFGYLTGLIFLGLFLTGLLLRGAAPEQVRKTVILFLNAHVWISLASNTVYYILEYKLHADVDSFWNLMIALWQFAVLYRIVLGESDGAGWRELAAALLFTGLFYGAFQYFDPPNFIYTAADTRPATTLNAEAVLDNQPALLDRAFAGIRPSASGHRDNYLIAMAPDAYQDVFRKEALFAQKAIDAHDGTRGRSLVLANTARHADTMPLSTITNLDDALARMGDLIQPDEDALILYLTSHGGDDATLETYLPGVSLIGFDGGALRGALDRSRFKWRIIVISACYAGSFIAPLKNDNTLIITAAAADRNSFGCSDENDLTYFGAAFLKDALPAARSWQDAYKKAAAIVAAREKAEGDKPSLPRMFVGKNIEKYLAAPQGDRPGAAPRAKRGGGRL